MGWSTIARGPQICSHWGHCVPQQLLISPWCSCVRLGPVSRRFFSIPLALSMVVKASMVFASDLCAAPTISATLFLSLSRAALFVSRAVLASSRFLFLSQKRHFSSRYSSPSPFRDRPYSSHNSQNTINVQQTLALSSVDLVCPSALMGVESMSACWIRTR